MSKLQDQLSKISQFFQPIIDCQALLDEVSKAQALLVDMEIAKTKAKKELEDAQKRRDAAIVKAEKEEIAIADKLAQKESSIKQEIDKLASNLAEARTVHKQEISKLQGEKEKKVSIVTDLVAKENSLKESISILEVRYEDALAKLTALKQAL